MAKTGSGFGEGGMPPPEFLVLGLGNPGPEYADTRHNFGFLVIEALARSRGRVLEHGPGPSLVCAAAIGSRPGLLAKPMTWMNRSGRAARALIERHGGPEPSRLLAVTDDLDLPLGRIRVRRDGGNGGHRGLRSLIDELGTREFPRLRLGIGRPEADAPADVVDWVLEPFRESERELVGEVVTRAAQAIETLVVEGVDAAMNRYNAGGSRENVGSEEEPAGE